MDTAARGGRASVVIPGVAAPSSVACVRSLGRRGIRPIVVSSDETTPAFHSKYCAEAIRVPSPHDDLVAYKDALRALAERPDVRTIVPVREPDIYVLSKYREEFAEFVATPWPDFETLSRTQDRIRLFSAAETAGVDAPETTLFTAPPDGDRQWIMKPRYTILGDEYLEEYTPETCVAPPSTTYLESTHTTSAESAQLEMHHVPLVQEYVSTTEEYGFFALYDEGEAVATFQHRQRRGYSYAGGPSSFRESVDIPTLKAAGLALLDELEWHGLAMVEFLRDEETGQFKLMEVNPRFWSSLPFTVRAGADFPYYYWLQAAGRTGEIDDVYESGIGGHLLRGEALYLYSILTDDIGLVEKPGFSSAVVDVARSLLTQPRFDYLTRDDPRPFVRDALNTISAIRS
ncbi:Predicted ATP-dependent carboligase, ATP-grasp superfamily [Natronorubrum sediminis]|uniref:Predicted ATP-dependent carboligase, ATP-grasp superfamily n=1 Tax=Natronorubrum sediminis TaxID=640943 RepID=A0A1H6G6J2_9EURY|nr:carboxylate--amine ligase [Natronorubrum sediminis]SEH18058.1 Predicted ATP-dependent carboligase, ATP-grasp superfamily [Natronorubrum sediminis]